MDRLRERIQVGFTTGKRLGGLLERKRQVRYILLKWRAQQDTKAEKALVGTQKEQTK